MMPATIGSDFVCGGHGGLLEGLQLLSCARYMVNHSVRMKRCSLTNIRAHDTRRRMGRDKLWEERLNVTLPKGAKAQIVAALGEDEDSLDLARAAISAELVRRGHAPLPDPKADQALRSKHGKPD